MADLVQSEEAVLNGANLITHLFNAMLPVSKESPNFNPAHPSNPASNFL